MDAQRRSFPAKHASLTGIMEFVELCGRELRLPPALTMKLLLIVEELFLNAVNYGCDSSTHTPVLLQLARAGNEVALKFEDCGIPYNPFAHIDRARHEAPLAERPVGGLGVMLVEGFASHVDYARVDDRNRIEVWLKVC